MILPALANDRRPAYMRISQNILPSNATVEHLICMPPPGGTQIYVPLDLTTVSATIVIVCFSCFSSRRSLCCSIGEASCVHRLLAEVGVIPGTAVISRVPGRYIRRWTLTCRSSCTFLAPPPCRLKKE